MTEPAAASPSLRDMAGRFPGWVKTNLPAAVASAALGGLIAYVANVWLMAVKYDGFAAPAGSPVTSEDNFFSGALFWALLNSLLFAVVGYRRAVGKEQFWRDVRSLPRVLASLFRADGRAGRSHLLWGAGTGLVAGLVVPRAAGAVLAVGVLATAPTVFGSMLSSIVFRAWSAVMRPFRPNRQGPAPGMQSMVVGVLGAAAALIVGFQVGDRATKLVLAVACGATAWYLGRRVQPPPVVTALLLVGGAAVAIELVWAARAVADDGGFAECGSSWSEWWRNCGGADRVRTLSAGGAVAGAAGGPLGWFVGDLLGRGYGGGFGGGGSGGGGGGEGGPFGPADQAAISQWVSGLVDDPAFTRWQEETGRHGPPGADDFTDYMGWRGEQGLPEPPLVLAGDGAGGEGPDGAGPGEGEPGDDDRPARYREGEDAEGDKEPVPDGREPAVDADGRPIVDPRTGDPLLVDENGMVRYGDALVTPEQAAEMTRLDQEWLDGRQHGQDLVDRFKDLQDELGRTTDPQARADLEAQIRQAAIDINADYPAKSILKAEGRSDAAAALDAEVQKIYGDVDARTAAELAEMGITRGGRPFQGDDFYDIRNASSAGTVGMDRDVALDQRDIRNLQDELSKLEPGSPEAQDVARRLADAQAEGRLGVDYDKYTRYLEGRAADAAAAGDTAAAERIQAELDRALGDADRLKTDYLKQLHDRLATTTDPDKVAAIEAEIAAARGRVAGVEEVRLSPSRWNDIAQNSYGRNYADATGTDADKAYQALTQAANPEAYRDLNVLANDPRNVPFDRASAEQTASVSGYKTTHNQHLADEGLITQGDAIQEDARGYAKDINSKTIKLLESDPGVDPAKLDQLRRIAETFERIGRGEIPPSQADAALRAAVPEIPGLDTSRAMAIADANLEAGIKFRGQMPPAGEAAARTAAPEAGGSRVAGTFGAVTDLATMEHYTQQGIAAGLNPAEAAAVAAAQTQAGNAAIAAGLADPRMSMVGGALLPQGVNNLLPDQAVENYVGTGYAAGRAGLEAINDSIASGSIDTQAIDRFADSVMAREGADPFKGYGEAAGLAGDLMNRTDGGSLASDLQQIYETGAGSEVLDQSMGEFQAEVESGKHGVVLQGLDQVAAVASDLAVDPATTVGQFVDDVRTIVTNGVGDGFWEEAGGQAKDVLERTPLVGTVVSGYEAIASGIGESGVTGFAGEMAEGAAALGGEAVDAVGNAVSDTYDYLRSWF
jgi:hypothetical protein